MNEQVIQIANRIKELREILALSEQSVSEAIGISCEQYLKYENAAEDIPIGVLYGISAFMKIDPTELLTGEAPRMADYTVIRQGKGASVERFKGYNFTSLAYNYIGRDMEPMIVDLTDDGEIHDLVTHGGQEFNYVLSGEIELSIGAHKIKLKAGDSVYFNPQIPHGQRAVGRQARFLTVINE